MREQREGRRNRGWIILDQVIQDGAARATSSGFANWFNQSRPHVPTGTQCHNRTAAPSVEPCEAATPASGGAKVLPPMRGSAEDRGQLADARRHTLRAPGTTAVQPMPRSSSKVPSRRQHPDSEAERRPRAAGSGQRV